MLLEDAIRSYELSDFTWDEDRNLYTYKNGKKVPERQLFLAIARHNSSVANNMKSHYTKNQGDLDKWEARMIEEIRANHHTLLEFGRGGKGKVVQGDRQSVEKYINSVELPALRKFKESIAAGNLSELQIKARISAYAHHAKVSYEDGRRSLYKSLGIKLGRRMLGSCKNHCPDCLAYAMRGYVPLKDLVMPGDRCMCLANCCCWIEYKN